MCLGLLMMAVMSATEGPTWDFADPAAAEAWVANAHFADVEAKDGALHARAVDWDPFFTLHGLELPATPWQCVVLRIRADKSGPGELFWSGVTEGPHGGFDAKKSTPFTVPGDGAWHDIVIYPFWHTEGTIRQLRLDLYEGAQFAIERISIQPWGEAGEPASTGGRWPLNRPAPESESQPGIGEIVLPPLRLDVSDKGWVAVTLRNPSAGENVTGSLLWASVDEAGLKTEEFELQTDGRDRTYNIELAGNPAWTQIVALGLRVPSGTFVESVELSDKPLGPPQIDVIYAGPEEGALRGSKENPGRFLVQIANIGGEKARGLFVRVDGRGGIRFETDASGPTELVDSLKHGEQHTFVIPMLEAAAGRHTVTYEVLSEAGADPAEPGRLASGQVEVEFLPPVEDAVSADYVPEPRPIETTADVCAYYFPGWDTPAKWDCIRRIAPIRRPLLGYYDESNPECVDWQIKWAVENGISCFLVDWYWSAGHQFLTHWFEAYRQARYRDHLKVAIMWANHNAPGTHSREDWRNVTREWIDHYFNLPSYYRIDGKPAVFLWDPNNIRNDLGGSEEVKAAFDESQEMARAAGYDGIVFVSMHAPRGEAQVRTLADEGYYAATSYHEWGEAQTLAPDPRRWRFDDVVDTVPDAWERYCDLAVAAGLVYYPVVDTGWDARPWHGTKSHQIDGRTPEKFEALLSKVKGFAGDSERPLVILGPLNEWGEGSYIEPATEYGFRMYEAVRKVFGAGAPEDWPVNLSPRDVGLGPYDYPPQPQVTSWSFDDGPGGWRAMMNVSPLRCEGGVLRFSTIAADPALIVDTPGLEAARYPRLEIRMQVIGELKPGSVGQLFWSEGGSSISEVASVRFPLATDGEMHTYVLDLGNHPRWRGEIATLRFDPGDTAGVEIAVDSFAFRE